MSTPIVETIAEKIVGLINEITIANSFNQDLVAVRPKRIHLEGDINTDGTVIVEQEDAEVAEDANEIIIWRQPFTLQALVIDSDTATTAIDTRLNQVRSDIEKKLMTGDNWKLDGYAYGILLRSAERFIADPQLAGIAVNIDVLYQVSAADPYSKT
jgi:hypothetical protein